MFDDEITAQQRMRISDAISELEEGPEAEALRYIAGQFREPESKGLSRQGGSKKDRAEMKSWIVRRAKGIRRAKRVEAHLED